jgi:hypothetical protein
MQKSRWGTVTAIQTGKEKDVEGKKRKIVRFFAVTVVSVLLLGGCASDGVLSTQKITTGEKAIMEAREGNATLTAAAELNAAEQNLTQAREAYAKKEYEKATRLADRASIDAEYARNKATTEKAKKRVEEMRGNIDALRQEIDRLSKQ